MALVELLELGTNLFGLKVAQLLEQDAKKLEQVQDICLKEQIKLLTCRLSTDDVAFAHELEKHGFQLMDTVTRYHLDFSRVPVASVPVQATIRPCRKSEAEDVAAIARVVYINHVGHFHNDPKLERDKCTELYVEIARNSCLDQNVADIMLVAETEGKIVGFHSHKIVNPDGLGGVISGVSHLAQGKGIGKALILASIDWAKSRGLEWNEQYPHINNYAMHKIMVDLGFKLSASFYTFHKWFD